MAIEIVCSCGQALRFEQPPAAGTARCPACQAIVTVPASDPAPGDDNPSASSGRKPLWAVMGKATEPARPAIDAPVQTPLADAAPASSTAARVETSETREGKPARKGLWGVMQNATVVDPLLESPQSAPPAAPVAPSVESAPARPSEPVEPPAAPPAEAEPALAAMIGFSANAALEAAHDKAAQALATGSRRAVLSLSLGIASIPIAFLALINTIWSRLPAPLVGFLAILLGLIAMQEIQRSAGRTTGRQYALFGIIAGIVGSFLGPVVVSGLGRRMMQSSQRGVTTGHLKTIGAALLECEKQRGAFPPGGVFRQNKAGDLRGYHGWMTTRLPWVGEGDLYAAIHQNLPYDDPLNLPVFEQDVPVFFAAGTDRDKVRIRFGASHFAGVGGDVVDEQSDDKRTLHAGLFGVNSKVKRDDVTDGLSNTLAVGEIASDLPAWGDPENWRTIGRGLNRDRQGFGNHDRSGACFLMADGSVRYFSNKTELRVLTALSTRDGGER